MNVPGESTLRREFLRLQQENKSNSEALKQQQMGPQHRDSEAHIKQLLHERQRRIEEQKEERRRVEEVGGKGSRTELLLPVCLDRPQHDWHVWRHPLSIRLITCIFMFNIAAAAPRAGAEETA